MTPNILRLNYEKIKPLIKGHGRQIAEEADVTYTQYNNAIQERLVNEEILQRIWSAMKAKAIELSEVVNDL